MKKNLNKSLNVIPEENSISRDYFHQSVCVNNLPVGLTVDPEVHGAPVFAGNEGVLPGVTPVGLRDGEAVQFPDGHIVEPLLH